MTPTVATSPSEFESLRRRLRLVSLLHAAEEAGLTPLPVLRLHTLAYLSNVLAPVWDLPVLEGKVLKRRGGPFYPALQHDLDRLVGMGMAVISGLGHRIDEDDAWRLEGSYELNPELANDVLSCLREFEDENGLLAFFEELAFAVSCLSDREFDKAMTEDATYSDPLTGIGNVVDFAEWRKNNHSANAAQRFEEAFPQGLRATPGEKLHLYVRHIHARISRVHG